MGDLNKLLQGVKASGVLGQDGVRFIRSAMKRTGKSLRFRDDVVHGHHQDGWGEAAVFRARGKQFIKDNSDYIQLSSRVLKRHANTILAAAGVIAHRGWLLR